MRKFIVFAAACLMFACSFLLIVQPAGAALTGTGPVAWEQVDQNHVNILDYLGGASTVAFGIYDWGAEDIQASGNYLQLFDGSETGWTGVNFDIDDTTHILTITSGGNGTITLTTGDLFGFYFDNFQTHYTYEEFVGAEGSYALSWDGQTYFSVDAKPVPIPTAALLLGSGLVGLVGFRRKRQNS